MEPIGLETGFKTLNMFKFQISLFVILLGELINYLTIKLVRQIYCDKTAMKDILI
jgi:hypothetical protein